MGIDTDSYRARIGNFNFVFKARRTRNMNNHISKSRDMDHWILPFLTVVMLALCLTPSQSQPWDPINTQRQLPSLSNHSSITGLYNYTLATECQVNIISQDYYTSQTMASYGRSDPSHMYVTLHLCSDVDCLIGNEGCKKTIVKYSVTSALTLSI